MTHYLKIAEVLAIHQDQIDRYEGLAGVRDGGLLESALNRIKLGCYADAMAKQQPLWKVLPKTILFQHPMQ